jgi:hypothetical protein
VFRTVSVYKRTIATGNSDETELLERFIASPNDAEARQALELLEKPPMTRRKELAMSDRVKIRKKVQFFARTIVAEAQNGTVKMGVADFSRTRVIAARARTSVEFEAGISREDAMAALRALLKEIETHGLPETSLSIGREHARKFVQMLRRFATAKHHYDGLSSKDQQRWRERRALETQRQDGPSLPLAAELFRVFKWSIQADVDGHTSGPTKR